MGWRKSFVALALGNRFAVMRFHLIDRILELEPGKRIRMVKNLTLGEEYLADHFPTFPVMPGVLMLQTLVEGSAWLLRATEDFQYSVIALRDARNVKYGNFMQPGHSMIITVETADYAPTNPAVVFKGKAEMEGSSTVSAKFTVTRYNLRDRNPALKDTDERIVAQLRSHYRILRGEFD
jgi:3-hydroxyacyl-[acyl-carrier-protein] dehydratase